MTMAQLALARVLREENVARRSSELSRPEQVEENATASGISLDDSDAPGDRRSDRRRHRPVSPLGFPGGARRARADRRRRPARRGLLSGGSSASSPRARLTRSGPGSSRERRIGRSESRCTGRSSSRGNLTPHPEGHRFGNVHFALRGTVCGRLDGAAAHVLGASTEICRPTRFDWMQATSYYAYHDPGRQTSLEL